MIVLSVDSTELLTGQLDVERFVARTPRSYTLKGMFFGPLVAELGSGFARLEATLIAPSGDRYLRFHDYPQADYLRLNAALAIKRFRTLGLREGLRRVARHDFDRFADSMIGKVVLASASDVRSTLLCLGDVFDRISCGGPVTTEELDARTVRIDFKKYFGVPEHTLGQLEGAALSFGGSSHVTVHELASDHFAFDVRHSER